MLSEINYPDVRFWDKEAEKINFINEQDFRRKKLIEALGLDGSPLASSLGIIDPEEIIRRQRNMRFLIKHERIAKCLAEGPVARVANFPLDGSSFLDYFRREKNPFYDILRDIFRRIDCCQDVTPEMQTLIDLFKNSAKSFEEAEMVMAKDISEEVQKAAFFEGSVDFSINENGRIGLRKNSCQTFGYRRFSRGRGKWWHNIGIPNRDFLGNKWLGRVVRRAIRFYNAQAKRIFYIPYLISEPPRVVLDAIQEFFFEKLTYLTGSVMRSFMGDNFSSKDEIVFKVCFRYSEKGLYVRLVDIKEEGTSRSEGCVVSLNSDRFEGFGWIKLRKIKRKEREMTNAVNRCQKNIGLLRLLDYINQKTNGVINSFLKVDSSETEMTLRWSTVEDFCEIRFHSSFQQIKEYRQFFAHHLATLKEIARVAITIKNVAKKWRKQLCYADILGNDRHLISFDSLEPIHLVGEVDPSKWVSIRSLPSLNGQMLGFTGQNAGGKSTTEETIVDAVFMAQSGLPNFGSKVKLNPKRRIGLVFIERGAGSTAELLLSKIRQILEALKEDDENGTLLIFDELGSATQEGDGLDFGKRLLRKLSGSCSVIFSTQIPQLAEFAQKEMSAQCHAFDLDHQITSGIGKSGLDQLMIRMDMDQLL